MEVVTTCNIKVGRIWHKAGETIDLPEAEIEKLRGAVRIVEDEKPQAPDKDKFVSDVFPPETEDAAEQPRKRGRKKKTDSE